MRATSIILVLIVSALIAWDIYIAFAQPGGTISETVLFFSHKHPIIPFALGVVCGHFFWSQKDDEKKQ